MSNLRTSHKRLSVGWCTLQNQWQTTTEQWQDIVCQRFEREYWSEYTNTIPAALRELDRLAETIERVRKDVP